MDTKNLPPGIYIESVSPLTALPIKPGDSILFCVSFQIVIPEQHEMRLDVEVLAYSLNDAAQKAFLKASTMLTSLGQVAKEASDALLRQMGQA
jgi:hypothetical protein